MSGSMIPTVCMKKLSGWIGEPSHPEYRHSLAERDCALNVRWRCRSRRGHSGKRVI
jgi:hypothetical protein